MLKIFKKSINKEILKRKSFVTDLRNIDWLPKAALPEPRLRAAAVASGDDIYLFGGELFREYTNGHLLTDPALDVLRYNNASNSWDIVSQLPSERGHCSAVITGHDVFIVGGVKQLRERVDVFNLLAESWVSLADFEGIVPFCGVALIHAHSIYAIGGLQSNGKITSKVLRYYISTQEVAPDDTCTPMPTPRFSFATAVGKDEVIYTIGGLGKYPASDGTMVQGRMDTVEAYNPATNTWKICAPLNVPRAELTAVTGPDGSIYALGGMHNGASCNSVERYDPVTDSWTEEPSFTQPRFYHTAALAGGSRIFVIGGQTKDSCDGVSEVLDSVEASTNPMP
jgi:N-acetylneuraminic acid mutarotase